MRRARELETQRTLGDAGNAWPHVGGAHDLDEPVTPTHIVVIDDGSADASAALAWTRYLARSLLMGADPVLAFGYGGSSFLANWASLQPRKQVEAGYDRGEIARSVAVAVVSAESGLLAVNHALTDLVVVGRGQVYRDTTGIPGAGKLRGDFRCPLAVVPVPVACECIQRIAVGVSGSVPSLRALRWCGGVARALGASVRAAWATGPLVEWVSETSPSSWRHIAERQLNSWIAPLLDDRVAADGRAVEEFRPAVALTAVAQEFGGGLVVVGAQRSGGLGDTALQLVGEGRTPVVVVP